VTIAAITGWGSALPDQVVTNADLAAILDTSDAWIVERTGIRERRVGGVTSELATAAARLALGRAHIGVEQIDLMILATATPDRTVPPSSAAVHRALGLHCGAFDLNAACAGFVYSMVTAYGAIATGARNVLVVGADCVSSIIDPTDRATAILFADGAGAIVLSAGAGEELVGFDLGIDSSGHDLLMRPHGGYLTMEGPEVFRRAVRTTVESASTALERAKLGPDDIALFVPHQANLRIVEAVISRLGIPLSRTAVVLDRTGNTSAASIPLALADAAESGRVKPGDRVLMTGIGAGMAWASAVVSWGVPTG